MVRIRTLAATSLVLLSLVASSGLAGATSNAFRVSIPQSAFLTPSEIDTGSSLRVVALTGNEVASASESGPNETCGYGSERGWVNWISREFLTKSGAIVGYERIVTYRGVKLDVSSVKANASFARTCAQRYRGDATYRDLRVSTLSVVGLGSPSASFAVSYTVGTGVNSGRRIVEYVADVAVANVFAEVVQSGYRARGHDPGSAALLRTAATARHKLLGIYAETTQLLMTVLPPATVPPVVRECSSPLSYSSDGNAAPLICANGGLNVNAWHFYAPLGRDVMGLGRDASIKQAEAAMCNDWTVNHATAPEEQSAGTLAAHYYGWPFVHQLESFQVGVSCTNSG